MEVNRDRLQKCAELITRAKQIICFTGAGMSAESGIGTFRGGNGLWSGMVGSIALAWFGTPIGWKWTPNLAWSQYINKFYNPIRDAHPNEGHRALVRLQALYPAMLIVTQNVDGLHQMAGSIPHQVFELHGTVRRNRCVRHDHPYESSGEKDLPTKSPRCRTDGCDSTLRPDCVLFTESLPRDQWLGAESAIQKLEVGDAMIIVGTSAQVYPAASLPELAAERGATLIDVNLEQTQFSRLQNYEHLKGTAAKTLPQLVELIEQLKHRSNLN